MKNDIAKSLTIEQLKQQYKLDNKEISKAIELNKSGLNKVENELNNYVEVTTRDIRNLQDQVDGNITTWFLNGVPTLNNEPAVNWTSQEEKNRHLGDLYYDNSTGYAYRFAYENNVFKWKKITDTDVTEALALANSAKDTADSKRRVFLTTPTPPYDNGDLWVRNNEIYICQISKGEHESYSASDFINNLKYTDDTKANEVDGKVAVVAGRVTIVEQGIDEISQQVEENKYFIDGEGHKQLISQSMTTVVQDIDHIEEEISHIELKKSYTWIKYADDKHGTNMSSNPEGKSYIGISPNQETSTASDDPTDYTWSLIKGPSGEDGKDAAIQSPTEPEDTTMLWFDTVNLQLKSYNSDLQEWVVANDFSDDIESLNNKFNSYFTIEQVNSLIQTATDGLTNKLTNKGGSNYISNSALYSGTTNNYDYWDGNAEKEIYDLSLSNTAIKLKNGNFSQSKAVANGTYTLSFKYERINPLGTASVKFNDIEIPLGVSGTYERSFEITTKSFSLDLICNLDNSYRIYELMLNVGNTASVWEQAPNEVHTDTVNISKGVTVEATENDTITHIGADGLKTVNKNTNETVLKATDTGIETTDVQATSGIVGGLMLKKIGNQTIGVGV